MNPALPGGGVSPIHPRRFRLRGTRSVREIDPVLFTNPAAMPDSMPDTSVMREPRWIRGRFRHGIGLQTPRSKDSHCNGSLKGVPKWEGGSEV